MFVPARVTQVEDRGSERTENFAEKGQRKIISLTPSRLVNASHEFAWKGCEDRNWEDGWPGRYKLWLRLIDANANLALKMFHFIRPMSAALKHNCTFADNVLRDYHRILPRVERLRKPFRRSGSSPVPKVHEIHSGKTRKLLRSKQFILNLPPQKAGEKDDAWSPQVVLETSNRPFCASFHYFSPAQIQVIPLCFSVCLFMMEIW